MHSPNLGFLSDPLPSGPGDGHSTPVPTRVGHSMPVASQHPDLRQAPQSWPKGDFIDFVDFAVFLSILGQSFKCARKQYANLVTESDSPKLGFLAIRFPGGLEAATPCPCPPGLGTPCPYRATPRPEAGVPVLAQRVILSILLILLSFRRCWVKVANVQGKSTQIW